MKKYAQKYEETCQKYDEINSEVDLKFAYCAPPPLRQRDLEIFRGPLLG